ncbi:MAG: MFS transporter [Rhodospirillaceae bacterium]|nr:MFS transporter [Rhodospirillaceae bacterium]
MCRGRNAPAVFPEAHTISTPVVVTEHLTKDYGPFRAVHDVSFEVGAGEVLGLLGPNGSGKTTILRILTGYLQPSGGTARIAGFDVVEQSLEARRHIGYVPEDVPLYGNMTVDEFLAFMGRIKGLYGSPLREAIDSSIEKLSLQPMRRRAIRKLSRGYRQRVAIAQALLNKPELLILDEPSNGLDPRQIIELRELIRWLAESHTVLVTSHILGEIERVASRVAVLLQGRLLAVESLDQLGHPRLRLRVRASTAEPVQTIIESAPGVVRVVSAASGEDGTHRFVVEIAEGSAAENIAAALTMGGVGLLEMTETRVDLENLFLDLTGGAAA